MSKHWSNLLKSQTESQPRTSIKECRNCHKEYVCKTEMQERNIGIDYDICPYCGACNGVSKSMLFVNKRLSWDVSQKDE